MHMCKYKCSCVCAYAYEYRCIFVMYVFVCVYVSYVKITIRMIDDQELKHSSSSCWGRVDALGLVLEGSTPLKIGCIRRLY